LGPGEIGFITAGIKAVADTKVGDTITEDRRPTAESRCRASSRRCRSCSAACSRSMPTSYEHLRDSSPSCG
jgi:translation elongation factor EF-4